MAPAVLVTGSNEIRDHVLAAAAAAGTGIRVCADAVELSALPTPGVLLVGTDQVAAVARSSVVGRARVHLVGGAGDQARLCEWSAALGATVLVLPDGLRWLAAALSGARDGHGAAVIAVVGASGGLGTSTLAAGLAGTAAEKGLRAAFVDLDVGGGGADLLFGLERQPGWRWPGLTAADGFLGDLHEHLPHAEGLAVVSHDRRDPTPVPVTAAVAVMRSLGRSHDVVVIDAGARPDPMTWRRSGSRMADCSSVRRRCADWRQPPSSCDGSTPTCQWLRCSADSGATAMAWRRSSARWGCRSLRSCRPTRALPRARIGETHPGATRAGRGGHIVGISLTG